MCYRVPLRDVASKGNPIIRYGMLSPELAADYSIRLQLLQSELACASLYNTPAYTQPRRALLHLHILSCMYTYIYMYVRMYM